MRVHVPDLYILTDARGFTTAITKRDAVNRELARVPLLVPITVCGWARVGAHFGVTWRKLTEYTWDGMLASWR